VTIAVQRGGTARVQATLSMLRGGTSTVRNWVGNTDPSVQGKMGQPQRRPADRSTSVGWRSGRSQGLGAAGPRRFPRRSQLQLTFTGFEGEMLMVRLVERMLLRAGLSSRPNPPTNAREKAGAIVSIRVEWNRCPESGQNAGPECRGLRRAPGPYKLHHTDPSIPGCDSAVQARRGDR
jgi:hypothetical protein